MRLLKFALTRLRSERGQALILAALAMVVILGFAALAIDVGYWYSQKREVQNAVDAAALAGAQELPDNPAGAETVAREYLTKNGVSEANGDTVSITFRRTDPEGDPTEWDTVVIEVERPAEAWFAKVFGINEALIKDVRAAASYRGGSTFVPVDVVQIIDRSGSMTGTDMDNVQAGVRALLEFFDASIQRVGLGVLSGGRTSPSPPDPCDAPATNPEPPAEDYALVLPVHLSDDFQSSPHVLDEGSSLVSTVDCLESDGYTPVGPTMKAAVDELLANGRPDLTWGIILFSDGVANRPIGGDTGWKSPTANAAAPGGDNNGFQTNPTYAYGNDSSRAEDPNSGSDTTTGCGDAGKDRHNFYNYGISVPVTNTVVGISVRLDAWISSTTSTNTRRMCVQLSWDGGVTWTAAKQTNNLGSSQQTFNLGGSADTWGHTWTASELTNANFRVRVTDVADRTDRTFYLDWAAVRVYHAPGNGMGPCDYAAHEADRARAAGIEVFTIGYGLHDPGNPGGNYCNDDDTGGWANRSGWDLMEYMATDEDHFFDQPSTADLRPIFEVIGSQLAAGAHLVE
jgi:hypothetical protein